ncbi:unnamed protein product, partial [Iphiclides podalirius]
MPRTLLCRTRHTKGGLSECKTLPQHKRSISATRRPELVEPHLPPHGVGFQPSIGTLAGYRALVLVALDVRFAGRVYIGVVARSKAVASRGADCIDRDYITTCVLSLRAQHAPCPPPPAPATCPSLADRHYGIALRSA